jgi:hypothetical protein
MYALNYIKRIEDYDEITAHFLKIFLNAEIRKKGFLVTE